MRISFTHPKRVFVSAVVVLAAVGGFSAVEANASGGGGANPPTANPRPARLAQKLLGAVAGGQTENYTGIKPCRILDTRPGTPIASTSRNFRATGSLASQGGSGSCGIPAHATSIAVNLTAISSGGTGFVRGWAFNDTPATATLLNFSPTINASNQVNIPLCRSTGPACTSAFTLRAFGSTDIVGDAVGYYTAPAYLAVQSTGGVYSGISSGVISATRLSVGTYEVTFDRSVVGCAMTGTDLIFTSNRDVSPDIESGLGGTVLVTVVDTANTAVDSFFFLTVDC